MYDGSLAEDWKAMITFQQLIILADKDGIIDMTVAALSRRTRIPLDILTSGIESLEAPDPESRSPSKDGRRIERLDGRRSWGWAIVNYKDYLLRGSRDKKNADDRERIAKQRNSKKPHGKGDVGPSSDVSQGVADGSDVSPSVADVAHIDIDVDKDIDNKNSIPDSGEPGYRNNSITNTTAPKDYTTRKKRRLYGQQLEWFHKFWDDFEKRDGK